MWKDLKHTTIFLKLIEQKCDFFAKDVTQNIVVSSHLKVLLHVYINTMVWCHFVGYAMTGLVIVRLVCGHCMWCMGFKFF